MNNSFERIYSPAMEEFIAMLLHDYTVLVGEEEMHETLQKISFPIFKLCQQHPFGVVVVAVALAMDMIMNAGTEEIGEDTLAEIEKELARQEHKYEHYN